MLDSADETRFAGVVAAAYAGATWISTEAVRRRPFASLAALKLALAQIVRAAPRAQQLELIAAHRTELVGEGLELLGAEYESRFGWAFVVATAGPRGTGLDESEIEATLARRLQGHADFEFAECLRQVHRMAEAHLNQALGDAPTLGNQVWDWAEALAADSDPGFKEQGQLTVTYLTAAHRACARRLADWMSGAGFDEVAIDAVGNVVGVYHGVDPSARRLLTGSHFDTVRNGGKYDGRLGILVPMACVQALARAGRRLPFGLEVVGFAEEEGQRYKAAFLGSGALTGDFDFAWLEQADADGVRMADAMRAAGLPADAAAIRALRRDPARYLGFVEVHIEQGPVLNELDLPLGIVTSINGGVRYVGEFVGVASHAGTTPMDRRRDAAAAVAELVLHVERTAGALHEAVGTVGILEVPAGSINVVPGRCRFSLDLRATTNAVRDELADRVLSEARHICERRGLRFSFERTMRVAAAPSAPAWQARWEQAVGALGLSIFRMPSGAGHDAMKLHEVMPQAMLFVRGANAGISHNPLESITNDDAELAVRAFQRLLDDLAAEPA